MMFTIFQEKVFSYTSELRTAILRFKHLNTSKENNNPQV